jgi:hypothetical protein
VRHSDFVWLAAVLLVGAAGVAVKLESAQRNMAADYDRTRADLVATVRETGFAISPQLLGNGRQYEARRAGCRIVVGVMSRLGQDLVLWKQLEREGGHLTFQLGSLTSSEYPRWRAAIADLQQRQLARLGIITDRPALIGLAQWGSCPGSFEGFSRLRVHMHRQASKAGRTEDEAEGEAIGANEAVPILAVD